MILTIIIMDIVVIEATSQAAVLVVDAQNDFCSPEGVFDRAGLRIDDLPDLVSTINDVTMRARSAGVPVVWVRMEWRDNGDVGILAERSHFLRDEGLREGSWGAQIVSGLAVAPDDLHMTKRRFSAFYNTELHDLLQRHGTRKLYVLGVRTDFCVESTVRDAFFRDYEVTVVADGVRGYFATLHEGSLAVMSTVFAQVADSKEVVEEIAQLAPSRASDGTRTSKPRP